MTATPIPRTLQMALSGVRELSLIATPPVDRLAVRTFVMPYDGVITREAILRERRSEEHTSELQSLMRISYAVFCLKKKRNIRLKQHETNNRTNHTHYNR